MFFFLPRKVPCFYVEFKIESDWNFIRTKKNITIDIKRESESIFVESEPRNQVDATPRLLLLPSPPASYPPKEFEGSFAWSEMLIYLRSHVVSYILFSAGHSEVHPL